jgi:hypothetical protein
MLKDLEQVVIAMGGKRMPRSSITWNPVDDDPILEYARFKLDTEQGEVVITAASPRPGASWPDYKCHGDNFKNKFAMTLFVKDGKLKTVPLTKGYVDITKENVERFLTTFKAKT